MAVTCDEHVIRGASRHFDVTAPDVWGDAGSAPHRNRERVPGRQRLHARNIVQPFCRAVLLREPLESSMYSGAVVKAIRGGAKAADKSWDGAEGLEWTLPSPAPYHTFETPPVVK